jgi:Arf-GAP/GTPase/ANK repeat/PH domain-containing protein 1/3
MSGPKVNDKQTQQSSDMRTNTNNNSVNNSINNTINSNNGLLLTNQSYYNNSLSIRQEIHRFESVHPSIYAIYDLLELITDPLLAQQIREHVVCIEGMLTFNHLIFFLLIIVIFIQSICRLSAVFISLSIFLVFISIERHLFFSFL